MVEVRDGSTDNCASTDLVAAGNVPIRASTACDTEVGIVDPAAGPSDATSVTKNGTPPVLSATSCARSSPTSWAMASIDSGRRRR